VEAKKRQITKNHNAQYSTLQAEYLQNRDNATLSKMYLIARTAAKNYLLDYIRTRNLQLDVRELSHDAAMYIIQRYITPLKPNKKPFAVDKLSAYIYFGIKKVLYSDYKKDVTITSLDQIRELNEKIPL
jgi:hypothetical protein